jgi:hypothetical protein
MLAGLLQVLALVGSGPALGNWDAAQAVRLSWREGHRWVANVQLEAGWHGALEFKVCVQKSYGLLTHP